MSAHKLGKAFIDLEQELWGVTGKSELFLMNRREIDLRPEIKALNRKARALGRVTPSRRKIDKREEHFKVWEAFKKEQKACLSAIYNEILRNSFEEPLPLRKHRDFDHLLDWRYCLYQGIIYRFDKQGLSIEKMLEEIIALEKPPSIEEKSFKEST